MEGNVHFVGHRWIQLIWESPIDLIKNKYRKTVGMDLTSDQWVDHTTGGCQ